MKLKKATAANKGRTANKPPPAADGQRKVPIRSEHRSESKKTVLDRTGAHQVEHARQTDRAAPDPRPARKQTPLKKSQGGEVKHPPVARAVPAPLQREAAPLLQRRRAMLLPKMLAPARPNAGTPKPVAPEKQRIADTQPTVGPQAAPGRQRNVAELDVLIAKYQALEAPKPTKQAPGPTPGAAMQQVADELDSFLADLALQASPVKPTKQANPSPVQVPLPTRTKATQDVLENLQQKKENQRETIRQGYLKQGWPAQAAKLFASEAIGKSPQKADEPTLRCYYILRQAGLPADMALKELNALPVKPGKDATDAFKAKAKSLPALRYDEDRIRLFCAARVLGKSEPSAQSIAKMGPYYLQLEQAGKVHEVRALLDEYRVSHSPLSFPRIVATVPEASMKELGSGSFNTVSSFTLDGQQYAFKPFLSRQELRKAEIAAHIRGDDAPDRVSLAGDLAAVDEDRHFPELRHIAVVRAAKALGLDGPDGVIGDAVVAIINGKPGLLMERAPGKPANQWFYYDNKLVPNTRPEDRKVAELVTRHAAALKDPVRAEDTRKMLGIYAVRFGSHGDIYLTGTGVSRNPTEDKQRFESPSYRRAMANAQLLTFIMNQADLHLGNLFVAPPATPDGEWKLTIIDADDAGGKRDARYWGSAAKESYLLVNQPKYLSAESVATMDKKAFEARMKNLDDDLAGSFTAEERKAIRERTTAVRESVKIKAAKVPVDDAEWASKKLRNPANSMTAKFSGIKLDA